MMSDEDIKEYHNIGRAIKHSDKYTYVDASRIEEHGSRLYDVNGARLPSVTTILGKTKDQQFIKDWKAKVGEAEAERMRIDYEENPSEESGEVDTENNLVRGSGIEIDLDTYDPDAPLGMPIEEEE